MTRLREAFRPEFVNRIDEIIIFRQLDETQLRQITSLLLEETTRRLHAQDVTVDFTTEAIDWLARRGFQPEFGARPLRRTIQREVDNRLSAMLLDGQLSPGQHVTVAREGDALAFRVSDGDHADATTRRCRPRRASPTRRPPPAARVARCPARRPAVGTVHSIRSQAVVSGGSSPVSSGPLASSTAACGGNGTGSPEMFAMQRTQSPPAAPVGTERRGRRRARRRPTAPRSSGHRRAAARNGGCAARPGRASASSRRGRTRPRP